MQLQVAVCIYIDYFISEASYLGIIYIYSLLQHTSSRAVAEDSNYHWPSSVWSIVMFLDEIDYCSNRSFLLGRKIINMAGKHFYRENNRKVWRRLRLRLPIDVICTAETLL